MSDCNCKQQEKQQQNYFDLHENFGSVEELELELSKVNDACQQFTAALIDAKLPTNMKVGLAYNAASMLAYNLHRQIDEMIDIDSIGETLDKLSTDGGEADV